MNEEIRKIEPRFIPCGDSFEKMNAEIDEDSLESVSGGTGENANARSEDYEGSVGAIVVM